MSILDNRRVVTICGSMRYYNHMLAEATKRTVLGEIVLMPFVLKVDDSIDSDMLDELHRDKIGISDAIVIVHAEGVDIGASTAEEIAYAQQSGKKIEWVEV